MEQQYQKMDLIKKNIHLSFCNWISALGIHCGTSLAGTTMYLFFFVCFNFILAEESQREFNLSNTEKKLNNPNFWISRHSNSKLLILDEKEIISMNQKLYKKGYYVHPLFVEKHISGKIISNYILKDLEWISKYIKYDIQKKRRRDPEFREYLKSIINFKFKSRTTIRFAITTKAINLRAFPTDMLLSRNTNDYDFDILQRSSISINEEIAIYHTSMDSNWCYIQTGFGTGWVRANEIAFGEKIMIEKYIQEKNQGGVVINSWASITLDKEVIKAPMGTLFVIEEKKNENFVIKMPINNQGALQFISALISKTDLSITYLPLTYSNTVIQSFKMLGEPYAWGGSGEDSDCSSFLQRVYKTMGIQLPRSSNYQVRHLPNLKNLENYSREKKILLLRQTPAGEALAFISGPNHIMLYLGSYNEKPYASHNTWSFYDDEGKEQYIKKVVVTSFDLGREGGNDLLGQLAKISSFR